MSQILFSQIDKSINADSVFESMFAQLKKMYEDISRTFYNGVNLVQGDRTKLITYILHFGKAENGDLLEKTKFFNSSFISFLYEIRNVLSIKIRGFRIDKLCKYLINQFAPANSTFDTIKYSVLSMLITGEVIRLTEDLYQYQLTSSKIDKKTCPHLYYANKGAEFLNLKWNGYYNRIWLTIQHTLNLTVGDIAELLLKASRPHEFGSEVKKEELPYVEKICVSFADYAYNNQLRKNSNCQNIFFNKLINCPISGYDVEAKFHYGYGLHGAIGECQMENGIQHLFVAFSGTEIGCKSLREVANNVHTDLVQILAMADSSYLAGLGIVLEMKAKYPDVPIVVVGHSLGGGLAQFSVSALADDLGKISAFCYNSAGLSGATNRLIKKNDNKRNITHIVLHDDPVSKIGKLRGSMKIVNCEYNLLTSHSLESVNCSINDVPVKAVLN